MTREERNIYSIVTAALTAGYAWLAYALIRGSAAAGFCYVRHFTGIPCPSCGSTRSVLSLLHGDIASSLMVNPIGLFIAVTMAVLPVWLFIDLVFKKKSFYSFYRRSEQLLRKPMIALPLIALVLINWIWNISKGL